MRIVFDHSAFSLQEHGGISRYFCELAGGLTRTKSVVPRIIAPLHVSRVLRAADHLPVTGMYMPRLARTHRLRQRINNLLSSGMIRRFRPDIVHRTYYLADISLPRQCRQVVTVFDMIHERFPDMMAPGEEIIPVRKRHCVQQADHVICISEQTRQDVVDIMGIAPEKTTVVYLGCSLGRSDRKGQDTGRPLVGSPYLLYVGERGGPKNFDCLLQAFACSTILPRQVRLVCFGGPSFSGRERQRIRELGCSEDQVLHLRGDDTMLADLYFRALALVYPSLYEGFGLPLLEAMACGCPVLCSDVSSMPEIAGDAALYFDPARVDDLMHAMESVIHDSDRREQLVAAGRKRVQRFSWQRCVRETMSVYEQCLA